jgi:sulfur-oxidizing protein SoxY
MKSAHIRVLAAAVLTAFTSASQAEAPTSENWPSLRAEIFNTAAIAEGDGVVMLQAPERAEDAALVPITVRVKDTPQSPVRKLTIIIDENPAPVAAVVSFGEDPERTERLLTTRIRVDRYSYVRAVAETGDGKLHMAARFVKASGGCSAPASKDAEMALRDLGKMQIATRRLDSSAAPLATETKIMVRHPNFSGLQIDEVTRGYRPAHFLRSLIVKQGTGLLMRIEAGISISENPHFVLARSTAEVGPITVTARDSEGAEFTGRADQPES